MFTNEKGKIFSFYLNARDTNLYWCSSEIALPPPLPPPPIQFSVRENYVGPTCVGNYLMPECRSIEFCAAWISFNCNVLSEQRYLTNQEIIEFREQCELNTMMHVGWLSWLHWWMFSIIMITPHPIPRRVCGLDQKVLYVNLFQKIYVS